MIVTGLRSPQVCETSISENQFTDGGEVGLPVNRRDMNEQFIRKTLNYQNSNMNVVKCVVAGTRLVLD